MAYIFSLIALASAVLAGCALESKDVKKYRRTGLFYFCISLLICSFVILTFYLHPNGEAIRFIDLPDGKWKVIARDDDLGNTLLRNEESKVVLHTIISKETKLASEFVRLDGKDYPIAPVPDESSVQTTAPPSVEKEEEQE